MKTLFDGINIHDRPDLCLNPVSASILAALESDDDYQLMLEPVTLEEIEHTYLANCDTVEEHILAAVTTKFSRVSKTMLAFKKKLDKALVGTGIKAGVKTEFYDDGGMSQELAGVNISKPRKSGVISVVAAQIPLSDGQSTSIVFWAPDEDPQKITADDKLVAFRFLLNKRDITHVVAPSGGKDISLAQTVTALSNVIERNSKKFQATLKKAMAARKELADKQERLELLRDELDGVLDQIAEIDSVNSELDSRKKELELTVEAKERRFTGLKAEVEDFKPKVDPVEPNEPPVTDEPEPPEIPEELQKHLNTLDSLIAGGFTVEEAVEQINEVSTYLEGAMLWDYHGEKFNEASEHVAEAMKARLEMHENAS